jgi:hypothetical protein
MKVQIVTKPDHGASIIIDGQDVSSQVVDYRIRHVAGNRPTLVLVLQPLALLVSGPAFKQDDVKVRMEGVPTVYLEKIREEIDQVLPRRKGR